MIFLGAQLMRIKNPGEAVYLMQNTSLFIVNVIRIIISNKKAWVYAIWPLIKLVSLPYCILVFLWVHLDDHKIFHLLSLSLLFPMFVLLGVLVALRQKTSAMGFQVAQHLGLVVLVAASLSSMYTLYTFFMQRKQLLDD